MIEGINPEKKTKPQPLIKGLEDLGALALVRPEQLWSDKGTYFLGPLMTRFKKRKGHKS